MLKIRQSWDSLIFNMGIPILHSAPTGARNSSLGHPNMAEASLGKNFPKVIPSLLHVFNAWYLQSLVIWCVSLSRPQIFLGKRRHLARRGDDISSRDARISTRGCPKLQRLDKPGCPKLRKDARIWIKMSEWEITDLIHYSDIIIGAIASQITSLTIVYSTVFSDADKKTHQSAVSLAFVRGIDRGQVNSPHKWPVTRKMFPLDDVIMNSVVLFLMVKTIIHQRNPMHNDVLN